jgi:chorismate mutase
VKRTVVRSDAIHFNLQVVRAASVQKRDIIGDILNETETLVSQAENDAGDFVKQITNVIANVTADLQARATAMAAVVVSVPTCAFAQTQNVASFVNQTGMLLNQLYQLLVTLLRNLVNTVLNIRLP